jgi:hypothetical protein
MKRIPAAALAAFLAVPAWAQQPPARPDTMTLTGADGKSHSCKIIRSYKHSNGGTAFEVRDTVTGETMTVIDAADKTGESKPAPAPTATPKANNGSKVQVGFDDGKAAPPAAKAPPQAAKTEPAKPAPRRLLNWFRNDPPAPKPTQNQSSQTMSPKGDTLAIYDRDPVIRLIGSMNDDLLPSMREVSAETLARIAKDRPEVVEAMIRSAKNDPAPNVRICCCRCLVSMEVRSAECVTALKSLEDDREKSVRTAAAAALSLMEQP